MSCTPNELPAGFLTLDYTETSKGVACISGMYAAHIIFAYVCVAAGFIALLSRIIPRLKWLHKYAGITFMLSMYFVEGSSILIFNTGLPRAIIVFLTIMLFTMTLGYSSIKIHQEIFKQRVYKLADEIQDKSESVTATLKKAERELLSKPRRWYQRLISFKAVHGYLMVIAWYQMAGRAGVTNPFTSWEQCYVYPVYKELGDDGELVLYPGITDEEKIQQLEFAAYIEIPAFIIFAILGIILCFLYAYFAQRKYNRENSALLE